MRIEIEIPKAFEEHFKQDKFEDSLYRLCADAHLIAGNYEKETAIMLIKAFKESKPAYDTEKVIELLKKATQYVDLSNPSSPIRSEVKCIHPRVAIEIVRKGGAE